MTEGIFNKVRIYDLLWLNTLKEFFLISKFTRLSKNYLLCYPIIRLLNELSLSWWLLYFMHKIISFLVEFSDWKIILIFRKNRSRNRCLTNINSSVLDLLLILNFKFYNKFDYNSNTCISHKALISSHLIRSPINSTIVFIFSQYWLWSMFPF